MCDTLLRIHVYFHVLNYISVSVIFMLYAICDIYVICDMCALYFDLYICRVTWLYSFALLPHFTPMQMSFITCTHAYFISFDYIMLAWVI